jgi:hypothetical protein
MEPKYWLTYLQKTATGPYPIQSDPNSNVLLFRYMFSFALNLSVPNSLRCRILR